MVFTTVLTLAQAKLIRQYLHERGHTDILISEVPLAAGAGIGFDVRSPTVEVREMQDAVAWSEEQLARLTEEIAL